MKFGKILICLVVFCCFSVSFCIAGLKSKPIKTVVLQKYKDKSENAFSCLIPKGWKTDGGIERVDPNAAGGAAQSIEAKFDFTVKKDDKGTVQIHWMPHIYFADLTGQNIAQYFPVGSNYNGMTVYPCLNAEDILTQLAFPITRPNATEVKVLEKKSLPKIAALFKDFWDNKIAKYLPIKMDFKYDAAYILVTYNESGVKYKEFFFTAVENRGPLFAGQWSNRATVAARAPEAEFEQWAPVGKVVGDSFKFNPAWIAGELHGQIKRGEIVAKTQKEIEKIEREINENRRKTNAEINDSMYKNLTGQEDYINPFTKQVETGSNEWNYRWQNEYGDIIYTNDMNYKPNSDPNLARQGFKQSKVKK